MTAVHVPEADDLWEGEKLGVRVGGVPVLLIRLDGEVRAFLDRCAHQAALLSPGTLEGGVLTCPVHGWAYDARTGHGVNPRTARLATLPVERRGEQVWIDVEAAR